MICEQFIDFVKQVVPSVREEIAEDLKEWIRQTGKNIEYESYYSYEQNDLIQGDVIDGIKFILIDKNGKLFVTPKMKAMIMSTSCDIAQDNNITLCPLFENSDLNQSALYDVKHNIKYDTFYINSEAIKDCHVKFSVSNTVDKEFIYTALKEGKIKKIFTMNMLTYYLFLVKLTIHYMRIEDDEVKGLRKTKNSNI